MDGTAPGKVGLTLEERLAALRRLPIDESLSLGLDIGIASCGWAVARVDGTPGIVLMGSRCFEAPENPKTSELLNKARRQYRGQRRVVRRRRQRMRAVRRLLDEVGLLTSPVPLLPGERPALAPDPWKWRAEGLSRALMPREFAAALIHIARHRGFWSNSKRDRGANAPDENGKVLAGIAALEEKVAAWPTFGAMIARDDTFRDRKRNRAGVYDRTPKRDLIADEVRKLFGAQRRLGNTAATEELGERFAAIAFHQRPLQDSEAMVGPCTFEPGERRAARNGYSFELFRFLARLTTLTLVEGPGRFRRLTPGELRGAVRDFGAQKTITYKTLRGKLNLPDAVSFEGVPRAGDGTAGRGGRAKDGEARDVVASAGAAAGTSTLRQAIGDGAFRALLGTPEKLDRIAEIVSFRDDFARIAVGLDEIGLDAPVHAALAAAVERGDFADFRQSGHVSAKAARKMIPRFLDGAPDYDKAAEAAGYVHTTRRTEPIEKIGSPTVRRSLGEAVKQVLAVLNELGARPRCIHVELARDVGRSAEMRDEIRRGIEKRRKERETARVDFLALVGRERCSDEELLRYELWREQQERCVYTDDYIQPDWLLDGPHEVQTDHALPRSRSQDNSRVNLVLCRVGANQQKGNKTPYEWFGADAARWAAFTARVERLPVKGIKKRNLLMRSFADREAKFLERNLTDTRYAAKALLGALEAVYGGRDTDGRRRLYARPGQITWNMRKAWGVEDLKKSPEGERKGDRHHALDALVCACTTESELQAVTREMQRMETAGRSREVVAVPPPWPSFRQDAAAALARVFVSRGEIRRARGEGHGATIYAVSEREGETVIYERKAVDKLTEKDLERIKDPERNAATVAALRNWIARGKPKGEPPHSPRGDAIRKVRLATNKKPALSIRGGHADRTEMVRVDVFQKGKKYHLVPAYLYQVVDRASWPEPPKLAVIAHTDEAGWNRIDETYSFLFSLYPYAYVEVVRSTGEIVEGYYRGTNISNGSVTLSDVADKSVLIQSIGARTLRSFRKFQVDRLGRRSEIPRETRTWRGAVCT